MVRLHSIRVQRNFHADRESIARNSEVSILRYYRLSVCCIGVLGTTIPGVKTISNLDEAYIVLMGSITTVQLSQ